MSRSCDHDHGDISFFLPEDLSRCHHCGGSGDKKTKLKKCGACNTAMYCSKECQKLAWPAHKAGCRTQSNPASPVKPKPKKAPGPETPEERRTRLLAEMGFDSAVELAHSLKTWAECHRWAFTTMTKASVTLHGGPDVLTLDPAQGAPMFMSYTLVPSKGAAADNSPASKFILESLGMITVDEFQEGNQILLKAWEDAEPGRRSMEEAFAKMDDPDFAGVISVVYFLKDTGMVVHNQHAVRRPRDRAPLTERQQLALKDILGMCKGSVSAGVALRVPEDSADRMPVPGLFERRKKEWVWRPLFTGKDSWASLMKIMPFWVSKSGLQPQDIFQVFQNLFPRS